MAYTAPTTMVAGQIFTASRWNVEVKANFEHIVANYPTLAANNSFAGNNTFAGTTTFGGNVLVSGATQIIDGGNKVSVKGDGSAGGAAYFVAQNSTAAVSTYFGVTASGGFAGTFTNHAFDIRTNNSVRINILASGGVQFANTQLGFFGTTPINKPTITGSRGGNVALTSLLGWLHALGLITDSSS